MFDFGRRKIVGMHYTRYIALPKAWLKNCNLRMGDFVQVLLNDDGSLVVRSCRKARNLEEIQSRA